MCSALHASRCRSREACYFFGAGLTGALQKIPRRDCVYQSQQAMLDRENAGLVQRLCSLRRQFSSKERRKAPGLLENSIPVQDRQSAYSLVNSTDLKYHRSRVEWVQQRHVTDWGERDADEIS